MISIHLGITKKDYLSFVLVFLICFVGFYLLTPSQTTVKVEMSSSAEMDAGVFYATNSNYTEEQKVSFYVEEASIFNTYIISLPEGLQFTKLRFDFAAEPTDIKIRSITVISSAGELYLNSLSLAEKITSLNHFYIGATSLSHMALTSTGLEPYFDIDLPQELYPPMSIKNVVRLLRVIIMALFLSVVYHYLFNKIESFEQYITLQRLGICALLFAVLMIGGKFHRSSIELWNEYMPQDNAESSVVLGDALLVRSDEWEVQTPWILSQLYNQKSINENNIGPAGTPLITAVPVAHITTIGQPKFWGFALFDQERGFSWLWAYKVVGLFCALFALIYLVTKSKFYALAGAGWIYSSSFIQWWFSSNLPEILIGFSLSISSLILIFSSKNSIKIICAGLGLFIFGLSTLLHAYPPFIIPLFYLGLFCSVAATWEIRNKLAENIKLKLVVFVVSISVIVVFGLITWFDASTAIDIASNTIYPGKRVSLGGDLKVERLFVGLFEFWRISELSFPQRYMNASETSSFLIVWPITLLFSLFFNRKLLSEPLILGLAAYCGFILIWLLVGFSNTWATLTGMSYSPSFRAILGLGIAGVLLTVMVANKISSQPIHPSKKLELLVFVGTFMAIVGIGIIFSRLDPFFTMNRTLASALVVSALVSSLTFGRKPLILFCIIVISVPGLMVNPIARGLAPLTNKDIILKAKAIKAENNKSKWVIFGSGVLPQAFSANGLDTVDGERFIPNLEHMKILDPTSKYKTVWNRYAQIVFVVSQNPTPQFLLLGRAYYGILVSPCSDSLKEMGVTHIGSNRQFDDKEYDCLSSISDSPLNEVYLYAIK